MTILSKRLANGAVANGTLTIGTGGTSTDNFSITNVADLVAPSKTAESIPATNGSGTIDFDEAPASFDTITIRKASDNSIVGGTATVSSIVGNRVTLSITWPSLPGEFLYIQGTVKDAANNPRVIQTSPTEMPALTAPTGLTFSNGGDTLSWNAVAGASYYKVVNVTDGNNVVYTGAATTANGFTTTAFP